MGLVSAIWTSRGMNKLLVLVLLGTALLLSNVVVSLCRAGVSHAHTMFLSPCSFPDTARSRWTALLPFLSCGWGWAQCLSMATACASVTVRVRIRQQPRLRFFSPSCFWGGNVSGCGATTTLGKIGLGVHHQIQELTTDRHASTVQPTSNDNKNKCDLRLEPKKNKAWMQEKGKGKQVADVYSVCPKIKVVLVLS